MSGDQGWKPVGTPVQQYGVLFVECLRGWTNSVGDCSYGGGGGQWERGACMCRDGDLVDLCFKSLYISFTGMIVRNKEKIMDQ